MDIKSISIKEFKEILKGDCSDKMIIDIRGASELQKMPMAEGCVNIPMDVLQNEIDDLPDDKPIYIVCAKGMRAAKIAPVLAMAGKTPIVVQGGMHAYYEEEK